MSSLIVDNQFGRETWSLSELLDFVNEGNIQCTSDDELDVIFDLCGWDVKSYKIIEEGS
tara:strand:- start:286 stop:462 length:177 start_codon:yes stop_codon:yes gene_type:complete